MAHKDTTRVPIGIAAPLGSRQALRRALADLHQPNRFDRVIAALRELVRARNEGGNALA